MSLDSVRKYLSQFNAENRILEFPVSSATVDLAAQALGCEAGKIAKTLSFDVKGKIMLVVMAGDCKIDNAKYKAFFHAKAKMLTADEVLKYVGHEVGGVCPFGVPDNVDICLDVSLKKYKTVYPACGSSNSAIELTPDELETYTKSSNWVDVCKLSA